MEENNLSLDMSDMSDNETVYSNPETCVSDTETAVHELDFPTTISNETISTRFIDVHTPYLSRKRYENHDELKRTNPKALPLLPPPASIKFSFRDFTAALGRALLVAQHTPISRTQNKEASIAEFRSNAKKLGVKIDDAVPENTESVNAVEMKRMLMMSTLKWAERWKESELPKGVKKAALYNDLVNFIVTAARIKRREDAEMKAFGLDTPAYGEADWCEVMEQDLAASRWARWG
ncbi:hypothetical protein PQX77_005453 [Marasmius sp. AFHP31]|nr:hypothetical protein PQX77_005453 [Marasmius sp. AFHP31]